MFYLIIVNQIPTVNKCYYIGHKINTSKEMQSGNADAT